MKVYADNAATTQMSKTAINAMLPYFDNIYGNPSSLYTIGQEAKEALENARNRSLPGLYAPGDYLYLRRQRGRQSGHPLGSPERSQEGQEAHHHDRF